MTEKELIRLEEIASQINAFSFYILGQCAKENLEDFKQQAKNVFSKYSPELFQKHIQDGIQLFDKHLDFDAWLKLPGYEFKYWSSRNNVIAGIILEFMGILSEIHNVIESIVARNIQVQEKPFMFYFKTIEGRIDSLISLLYAPGLETQCRYLSNKLYGIYHSHNILAEDIGFAERTENQYERFCTGKNSGSNDSDKLLIHIQRRNLLILEALHNAHPEILTLEKISEKAKRSKQTVFTALKELCKDGFVAQDKNKHYIITEAGIEYFEKHFS